MVKDIEEEEAMINSLMDWRKAVKTPPSYRVGTNTVRIQPQVLFFVTAGLVIFIYVFYGLPGSSTTRSPNDSPSHSQSTDDSYKLHATYRKNSYNSTYPLTPPVIVHDTVRFSIGVVSDMDHSSKSKLEANTWISYFMKGTLVWNPSAKTVSISWDRHGYKTLKSSYAFSGRGMELSELVTFNGKLVTFDDRSGITYTIENDKAIPWVLLIGGDGTSSKGFKSEWAAVKDNELYVGSMGKEWTTPSGDFINNDPMYVKKISTTGEVSHLYWRNQYVALREKVGIHFPGYILHESATWSDIHRKWFFLPRRLSAEGYNEEKDEHQGTNLLFSCDDQFDNFEVITVGEVLPTHGYSSFKFIPGTDDTVIVALKTTEVNGKTATYITVFNVQGKILYGETMVDNLKYEGFEFI